MSNLPQTNTVRKPSPFRFVAMGCGGLLIISLIAVSVFFYKVQAERQKPVDKTAALRSLAGVPIYPRAQFDEDGTRDARAALRHTQDLAPEKMATVVAFRIDADPDTQIIPFYDQAMGGLGFRKTRDIIGKVGATYTNGDTIVQVQPQPIAPDEAGEPRSVHILRFDAEAAGMLGRDSTLVTPEDFKKAQKEFEKTHKKAK